MNTQIESRVSPRATVLLIHDKEGTPKNTSGEIIHKWNVREDICL